MKLYKLSSVLASREQTSTQNYQWFIINRKPSYDYSQLISNYAHLEGKAKIYAEGLIDELFTEEEVKAFQIYIRSNYNTELVIEEYELPMFYNGEAPLGSITTCIENSFFSICEESSYDLAFHVWGYCSQNKKDQIERHTQLVDYTSLSEYEQQKEKENIKNAMTYLRKSLRMINPQMHVSDPQLDCIASYLLEQGFAVEKTLTKEQKLALKALKPDIRVNS